MDDEVERVCKTMGTDVLWLDDEILLVHSAQAIVSREAKHSTMISGRKSSD
jgi:hypothetical protein